MPGEREALTTLLETSADLEIVDTVELQLLELMEIRHPKERLPATELRRLALEHLAGVPTQTYGRWVHLPWARQLVHVLPPAEFREVRLSRNRYKITPAEQDALRQHRIGIAGLSVGYAIATTLAMEGVGGEFRLADFDTMSLSNTNRVPAGIAALGINKAVIAARRMFEIDPFLQISIFPAGLSPANLAEFLDAPTALTLLIEECDDLLMKIMLREQARARGIPVLMETNDRGLLDVERFDAEPRRPLLHGLLEGIPADSVRGLSARQKVPIIFRVLGGTAMSSRLAASLAEIDETVTGWSQLGSGTMLGGAVVTDVARRLLLGEFKQSGRFYLDVQALVADGTGLMTVAEDEAAAAIPTAEESAASGLLAAVGRLTSALSAARPGADRRFSREEARVLVEMASLAPSGGNRQPWRFVLLGDGRMRCMLDLERAADSFLDFRLGAAYAACGAGRENFRLAAAGLGLRVELVDFPLPGDDTVVWEASLLARGPAQAERDATFRIIAGRCTNRRLGQRTHLAASEQRALVESVTTTGGELLLLGDNDAELGVLADYAASVDRFRFFCKRLYREMVDEVRWTTAEAERTRDGIDLGTLELDAIDTAGMHLLSKWSTVELMKRIGGRRVEDLGRRTVQASAAIGLVRVPGATPAAYVAGGVAMQRVWLAATGLGLAFQPLAVGPYLYARLTRGAGDGFDSAEVRELTKLHAWHQELFRTPLEHAEVLLFRVGHAPEPRRRSLRRHVDDVLAFQTEV